MSDPISLAANPAVKPASEPEPAATDAADGTSTGGAALTPAVSTDVVAISRADLEAMLRSAVAAGVAQAQAAATAGPAVVAEKPEDLGVRGLLTALVLKSRWHTEREWRNALHTIDTHFPAPEESVSA